VGAHSGIAYSAGSLAHPARFAGLSRSLVATVVIRSSLNSSRIAKNMQYDKGLSNPGVLLPDP
jgi:hypothetical protein